MAEEGEAPAPRARWWPAAFGFRRKTSKPSPPPSPATPGKAIVLFSDGTGNSSGKLFKTNVWRMYEAVDLGPPAPDRRAQVAFYDNGVGTSGIGVLAAVTGIFGYGLKRNVLDIYRYASRNYRPGPNQLPGNDPEEGSDEIYGFGFSRGGFTMRIVAALIASEGLVVAQSDAERKRKTLDAYRAFRRSFEPGKMKTPVLVVRALRDGAITLWRKIRGIPLYDSNENYIPVIRFLGIWDTVSAYGGPIIELTRAIDDWVFPLSMPDLQLNARVRRARHALAIDDSRDAFHPLLWDEVHEQKLIESNEVAADRLQQVWFAGTHADVGGGYPDESLSYISLLWMLEEAKDSGLRMVDAITERHLALASSFGPLHDSRAGPGAYYRYQPRRIGAWLDPPEPDTGIIRDPALRRKNRKPRGLLRTVQVHESVISRIAEGTDSYAPITLPGRIEIAPAQMEGEDKPQRDSESSAGERRPQWRRLIDPAVRARIADPEVATARAEAAKQIWDAVFVRRLIYFATLAATAWLVLLPFLADPETKVEDTVCADDRCVLPWLISQTKILLPKFAERWIDKYAADPGTFAILLAAVLILLWLGSRTEASIADRSHRIWEATLGRGLWPEPPGAPLSWFWSALRFVRTSTPYQFIVRLVKWDLLPRVLGWMLIAALLYALSIAATQLWLALREPADRFCTSPRVDPPPARTFALTRFDTRRPCTYLGGRVRKGYTYQLRLSEVKNGPEGEGWLDGSFPTSPEGLEAGAMGWRGYLGAPLRRVVGARYMQPLVEVRERRRGNLWAGVHIQKVRMSRASDGSYSGEFTAKGGGSLHLFVNDVAPPFGLTERFYGNNRGYADVTVTQVRAPASTRRPRPVPPRSRSGLQ